MKTPFVRMEPQELHATIVALSDAGGTDEHATWIRAEGHALRVVQFINQFLNPVRENPYKMTVGDQLFALRHANDEEGWGISETDFDRLASTAPSWPEGEHVYRSFRIRFGEWNEGVSRTFEAHCQRIQHIFGGDQYWRWAHLHSHPMPYDGKSVERLRLLNGNHTHHACIEWVIVDMDAHRTHESVTAVSGPDSLADELLVIAWLFPEMLCAVMDEERSGFFAGGYEVNVPEYIGPEWQYTVVVHFYEYENKRFICVNADENAHVYSGSRVPVLQEVGT